MKRVFVFALLSFLVAGNCFAQREKNNPPVNSREVINAASALYSNSKFKEAVQEYLKVSPSDTNYAEVLHDMYLTAYADSNFTDAEKYTIREMEMFPEKKSEWLTMLANIYNETDRSEKAITYYDSVLLYNKYAYLTYYNKALAYIRLKHYDKAIPALQKCVMLNPYYSSAHFFLGLCSLDKGNITEAMMSFSVSLLTSSDNRHRKSCVLLLNGIAENSTEINEYLKKYKPGAEDNFEDVQDIINSRAALDKKYKLQADLDDKIVRQIQVMMEKLEFNEKDKGFWMQYYVPLFKKEWNNKNFEPFIFLMLSDLDLSYVTDYVKKNKKKVSGVYDEMVAYLNEIRETQEINFTQRPKTSIRYYIKNLNVTGKGETRFNEKNELTYTGYWEFYYEDGGIKSSGTLDNNGKMSGEWKFYFENGQIKEKTIYKDGKGNGRTESWYKNGILSSEGKYADDLYDGTITVWQYNGLLQSVINYKAGKKEGPAKYYDTRGNLSSEAEFSDDLYDGNEREYFEDGKISAKAFYKADKAEGNYTTYYENGKNKNTGALVKGEKTGEWKEYYENGTLKSVSNYDGNNLEGDYKEYHENGKIMSALTYHKGLADGTVQEYDDDGLLYKEAVFEKGKLKDLKFYDKKKNLISSATVRKGNSTLTFYYPDGFKYEESSYTKDGVQEGKDVTWFRNGRIASESVYEKGYLQGIKKVYYQNGKIQQEGAYSLGSADGYFVDYYSNGMVSGEGRYIKGQRQGTYLYYNPQGDLITRTYYLNDEVSGIQEYFSPNGKPDYDEYYESGWFQKGVQYDSLKKVIASLTLDKGAGSLEFVHQNGKPQISSTYKHYNLTGISRTVNADGSPNAESHYIAGRRDSVYRAWYPNGKIKEEGYFVKGEKNGTWKSYWFNGSLSSAEEYKNGKLDGKGLYYNEDGSLDKEVHFKDNNYDGEFRGYADNKALAYVFYYKNDFLKGYSYEDKNGQLLPMIELAGGSGDVTAYFRNGVKSLSVHFNESLPDGPRIFYYTNGKEMISSTRDNGRETGNKKIYYLSGKLMKEENYTEGNLHGKASLFAEDGSPIYQLNYYNGELHGRCVYYEKAKPVEMIYYYGSMESKK